MIGGGEMGQLVRETDWARTPLGDYTTWPQSLRSSLSLVLNAKGIAALYWGPEQWLLYNDAYGVALGERHPHAFGRPMPEVLTDIAPVLSPQVAEVLRSGTGFSIENLPMVMRRNGTDEDTVWTYSFSPIQGEDGAYAGVLLSAIEMTQQRRVEDELRVLTAKLEQQVNVQTQERDRLWQLSQDPFMISDLQGRWVSVNPTWTELLGWSEEELVGRTSEWMEHPDDRKKTRDEIVDLAAGQTTLRFVNRFRTKDDDYRWFSWTAIAADGLLYCVAHDITDQRALEESRERLEEQLRQSQKMEAVGQLTGGLAHDFNNLLAGISGSLEMMKARIQQGRSGDIDRYILGAQGAVKRAAALTHRLLAFSRRQTLDPKPTDVNRLVAGMEELIRRTVGPQVSVETVGTSGLWPTLVDPPQLENALLNLSINARDAMPDGGKLVIETANRWMDERTAKERDLPAGQYVSVCVSDNGAGMPPEVVARAFDPFFTTKPIGLGTGLGLSMIYGFARQSGGQVKIYSDVGQGTKVCIYMPRHHEDAAAAMAQEEAAKLEPVGAGETVLVVDDEPLVRMLVADVLADLGYSAIEAADGPSAMKILRSNAQLDLLITDVGLPNGMNGRQIADAARELRPALNVLFMTGYAENAVLSHGHLDPGMQIVTKPFEIQVMAQRIRSLIGKN